ncbi:MAG: TldD/PmbA family protein [Armatimonadetes bacterium]|nr:TldD/PmbA family protein [Armatimonadota bacterium]
MDANNGKRIGREDLQDILEMALSHSVADQTQIAVEVGQGNLTRFAGSIIHQNVAERNAVVAVRAIFGKKIGFATGNSLVEDEVRRTVDKAVEFARHQQENSDFKSLPGPRPEPEAPRTFFDATAEFSAEDRAAAVERVVNVASKYDAEAAGSLSTGYEHTAVANSLGIRSFVSRTQSHLTMVMTADTGFGYSNRIAADVGKIDFVEAAEEAAGRAARSRNPVSIEPGEYDVILLPYCVEDILGFMSWLGFGALAVQEGRSFMAGKFGEKICGKNITIFDDGLDPRGIVYPFDGEGVPKQRVDMIVNGVANTVVYDSFTAYKEGKESTGHSTGGTGTQGPYAWSMFLAPGDATVESMIESTERGLFVTRFHYTNIIHPLQTVITGMTRDGTFLIENGKITKPVRNLRFTESILNALSNVEMIGKDLSPQGMATVPAIKVKNFRFTGVTEF